MRKKKAAGSNKSRFWEAFPSWEEAEKAWDKGKENFSSLFPLKKQKDSLPLSRFSSLEKRFLRMRGLKWTLSHDEKFSFLRFVLHKPFSYGWAFLCSFFSKKPYREDGDFFLFGLKSIDEFKTLMREKNAFLLIGFSYCEKPLECPCGRFSEECCHREEDPICRQCRIGKVFHALPRESTHFFVITTSEKVGKKILEMKKAFPDKLFLFLTTACEMSITMFSDVGNMMNMKGIGVRLAGRCCTTKKAFELAEKGVKPALTYLVPSTEEKLFSLLSFWYEEKKSQDTDNKEKKPHSF
jgi:hypothetical protein